MHARRAQGGRHADVPKLLHAFDCCTNRQVVPLRPGPRRPVRPPPSVDKLTHQRGIESEMRVVLIPLPGFDSGHHGRYWRGWETPLESQGGNGNRTQLRSNA
jgi:hypothetical protein